MERRAKTPRLAQHRKQRIPINVLLHSSIHEGVLRDPAADVTVSLALMIRQVIDQGDTIERDRLSNLQPNIVIVEDAQMCA